MKYLIIGLIGVSALFLSGCSIKQGQDNDKFTKINECKKIQNNYESDPVGGNSTFSVYYSTKTDYCILQKTYNSLDDRAIFTDLIDLSTDTTLGTYTFDCKSEECIKGNANYEIIKREYTQ